MPQVMNTCQICKTAALVKYEKLLHLSNIKNCCTCQICKTARKQGRVSKLKKGWHSQQTETVSVYSFCLTSSKRRHQHNCSSSRQYSGVLWGGRGRKDVPSLENWGDVPPSGTIKGTSPSGKLRGIPPCKNLKECSSLVKIEKGN